MLAALSRASAPLSLVSSTWDGPSINAGSFYGVLATVSGGIAPYTYALLIDGVQVASTSTSNTTGYSGALSNTTWNGKSVAIRVTDAASAVVTSSTLGALTVNWITALSLTPSSYAPPVGTIVSIAMSVSANPAPSSYNWAYQHKPAGGSWGPVTPFSWASALAYSGAFTTAGDQWIYHCTANNSAGSATRSTSIITVQP